MNDISTNIQCYCDSQAMKYCNRVLCKHEYYKEHYCLDTNIARLRYEYIETQQCKTDLQVVKFLILCYYNMHIVQKISVSKCADNCRLRHQVYLYPDWLTISKLIYTRWKEQKDVLRCRPIPLSG